MTTELSEKVTSMLISDQLREAIRAYDSVYAVARDSGVSQTTINRFVNGERDLYLGTVDRLCDFFGMRLTRPTRKRTKRKS